MTRGRALEVIAPTCAVAGCETALKWAHVRYQVCEPHAHSHCRACGKGPFIAIDGHCVGGYCADCHRVCKHPTS